MERKQTTFENSNIDNNIIDIDLGQTSKKRFRINGDDSRILELNTSDIGILSRLNAIYPKLVDLSREAVEKLPDSVSSDEDSEDSEAIELENIKIASEVLHEIDTKMRSYVDELFDSNVSEVCVPEGTMYDPFCGKYRFEHIIETLAALYETNLTNEFKKMRTNVEKHTSKYTKKYHK